MGPLEPNATADDPTMGPLEYSGIDDFDGSLLAARERFGDEYDFYRLSWGYLAAPAGSVVFAASDVPSLLAKITRHEQGELGAVLAVLADQVTVIREPRQVTAHEIVTRPLAGCRPQHRAAVQMDDGEPESAPADIERQLHPSTWPPNRWPPATTRAARRTL